MCRLFESTKSRDIFATAPGLTQFHNVIRDLKKHENSKNHILSELAYKNRSKEIGTLTLDTSIALQSEIDKKYWRSVLERVIAVIKHLGSRGQSFRGANQTCGSNQNGNFLGTLDLLSQFDPLIAIHIAKYGNQGKGIICFDSFISELSVNPFVLKISSGRANYLSGTICDELTNLIGTKLLNVIVTEIQQAEYFSISVDSTPDVSHCDQLVFCARYVKNDEPIERFLQFIEINQHKSEHLTSTIVNFMQKQSISRIVVANPMITPITWLGNIRGFNKEF